MFKTQRGLKTAAEFSSEDSDELPSSAKLGKSKSKGGSKKQKTGDVGFMDLGGKKVKKRSRKQKEATPVDSEEEEEDEDGDAASTAVSVLSPHGVAHVLKLQERHHCEENTYRRHPDLDRARRCRVGQCAKHPGHSKRLFAFMMMLFTLADSGDKENLPLITIPAQ